MIDFELVVDEMIIAARAAILDGEVLELDPSQFSDYMIHVMEKLRQAEKDAARYRWIKENSQLGVGKFGFDWELHFGGVAPDNHSLIEYHIDEAMKCNK